MGVLLTRRKFLLSSGVVALTARAFASVPLPRLRPPRPNADAATLSLWGDETGDLLLWGQESGPLLLWGDERPG